MNADSAPQTGPQIYSALLAAQQAMEPIRKDRENPHFRSAYATLSAVVDAIAGPLAAQSVVVLQTVEPRESGSALVTRLVHAPTGEQVTSTYPLVCKDPSDPQKFGSAITYARRYSLLALLNLTPEDDDGNAAATPPARQQSASPARNERQEERRSAPARQTTPATPRRVDSPAEARAAVGTGPAETPEKRLVRLKTDVRRWLEQGLVTDDEKTLALDSVSVESTSQLTPENIDDFYTVMRAIANGRRRSGAAA